MRSREKLNTLYIHSQNRPMITNIGNLMTCQHRLSPLKSHDPLVTWPANGHQKTWKKYMSWPLNLAEWWLKGAGWKYKYNANNKFLSFLSFFPLQQIWTDRQKLLLFFLSLLHTCVTNIRLIIMKFYLLSCHVL